MRCCKNSQRISSNSSNISDYVNIVEITSTQHYTRIVYNWFPEQKMLGNNTMNTASTSVTSIRSQNNVEKSTWRNRYFVDFESRIPIKTSTSNRCHNFHVDSPFKIDVISRNFPHGILTSNRWQIDKDVSIGFLPCVDSQSFLVRKRLQNCVRNLLQCSLRNTF